MSFLLALALARAASSPTTLTEPATTLTLAATGTVTQLLTLETRSLITRSDSATLGVACPSRPLAGHRPCGQRATSEQRNDQAG